MIASNTLGYYGQLFWAQMGGVHDLIESIVSSLVISTYDENL